MDFKNINRRDFLLAGSAAGIGALTGISGGALAAGTGNLVSIGGSITEIVVALGQKARLAGIDTTSTFPAALDAVKKVGYMRTLAAEGILSLGPKRVIASELAGPPPVISQLQSTGLLSVIPDKPSLDGIKAKILAVGEALEMPQQAAKLADEVSADLKAALEIIDSKVTPYVDSKPRAVFMHNIGRASPIAGGRDTPAATMITMAQGINAIDSFEGHKQISPEAMISAQPDMILMFAAAIESYGGLESVMALPHVKGTPAGRNRKVLTIDGLYTLGFGPRTAHALLDLARQLHPLLDIPSLPKRHWVDNA